MARTIGPLFSEEARKQLGKSIIFKTKAGKTFVTKYNKPGDKTSFNPSESQLEKREIYGAAIREWQALTEEQKEVFNEIVKDKNLKMSGWNYYYQQAVIDPDFFFGLAIYGQGIFGGAIYGNENY